MILTYDMYCSIQDALIEYIQYRQNLKSLRLTPKKCIELNLIEYEKRAHTFYSELKNGRSLKELTRKLIFWHYDHFDPVYEDYNYTRQRILETNKEKRWEKFKKIYPVV